MKRIKKFIGKALIFILCICFSLTPSLSASARTEAQIYAGFGIPGTGTEFTSHLDEVIILGHGALPMATCSFMRPTHPVGVYFARIDKIASGNLTAQIFVRAAFYRYTKEWADLSSITACPIVTSDSGEFYFDDSYHEQFIYFTSTGYDSRYYCPTNTQIDAYYLELEPTYTPTWVGRHVFRRNFSHSEGGMS